MKIVIEGVEYDIEPTQEQLNQVLDVVSGHSGKQSSEQKQCDICGEWFKGNRGVGLHKSHTHGGVE